MQLLSLLGLAGAVVAQSMTPSGTAPLVSATAMAGQTQRISVGSPSGGLVFQPNVVTAPVGSKLEFHFNPRNHSVVQGPYNQACQPLPSGGIYSGFMPTMMGEAAQTFTVTINDQNPIWLYCSEAMHCQSGMAMVVNPPPASSGQTLNGYFQAAKMVRQASQPNAVAGGTISTQRAGSAPTPTPGSGGSGGTSGGSGGSNGGSGGSSGGSGGGSSGGSTSGSAGSSRPTGAANANNVGSLGLAGAFAGAVGMLL